jgi:hypothetical protein
MDPRSRPLPFEHAEAEYDEFIRLNAQLTAQQMTLVMGMSSIRADRWSDEALDAIMSSARDLRAASEALAQHTGRNVSRWRRQRREWERMPQGRPLAAVEHARKFLLECWGGQRTLTIRDKEQARDLAHDLDDLFGAGDADA